MPLTDLGQGIGENARVLQMLRQRRLDGRDLVVDLVGIRSALDGLLFGRDLQFDLGDLRLQRRESGGKATNRD